MGIDMYLTEPEGRQSFQPHCYLYNSAIRMKAG